MKLFDLLKHSYEKYPDISAIKTSRGLLTYSDVFASCIQLAKILEKCGAVPGVNIGIVLENSEEYIISFFGICAAECTIVPLSSDMTSYELSHCFDNAGISIVISSMKSYDSIKSIDKSLTILSVQYNRNNFNVQVEQAGMITVDEDNGDVALMVSTSGTTGQPKYVCLTDDQLISNANQYLKVMQFTGRHTVYCALPFYHIYSITAQVLSHISRGDTFVISRGRFFTKDFMQSVEANHITITAFVPYLASLLADYSGSTEYDLQSLRYITLSGAKTLPSLYAKLTDMFPNINFINTYGMSEAGSRIAIAAPEPSGFPIESVGKPLSGVLVKIMSSEVMEMPTGDIGEIYIKSSGVMKGYYRESQINSDVFSDGWLKTGDLGRLDIEGNLFIVGRKKDLVISGAINIYPHEIEECLLKHPLILEAAVVKKYHSRLQEIPYAFIVTRDNLRIDYCEFVLHCRKYLSSYKIPGGFEILEAIPKIKTSKINRKKLNQLLDEGKRNEGNVFPSSV